MPRRCAAGSSLKSVVMTSEREDQLRAKCEGNGWRILVIQGIGREGMVFAFSRVLARELHSPIRIGVSIRELCSFCEAMQSWLSAGVSVQNAVSFCAKEERNRWFAKRLAVVLERLGNGDGLANAMEDPRCARAFPPLMRRAVRTGEANGNLAVSFARIAEALPLGFEKSKANRAVPAAVSGVCCLAVWFVLAMNIRPSTPLRLSHLALLFCSILAVGSIGWVIGLWIRRLTRSNISMKIARTKFSRMNRRFNLWLEEKMIVDDRPLWLLALTLIALPFGLEQIGEATGLFHFPATAWMRDVFR